MSKTRFNNLTEKDKQYIKTVHADKDLGWDHRMSILMTRFGVSERTVRKWIEKLGFSSYKEIENEEIRQGKLRTYENKNYYIITWSQNATPVHTTFWNNIQAYAKYLDAEIGVIQGRYMNPTSIFSTKNDYWDENLTPYLDGSRTNIHQYLDILGDVKISPTATAPLSGLGGLTSTRSSIVGHPRVHLESLPVLQGHPNKVLVTTGACTIKNYSDTKVGKKAEFHHTYGFVIVEIEDDLTFHIRQVTASDDGSFIDLIHSVEDGKVSTVDTCSAFILGDIHTANVEESILDSTFRLFDHLAPKNIILHDIFDGVSVNHHEKSDPILAYRNHVSGRDVVENEINGLKSLIDRYDMIRFDPIVIRSNHDRWLERWIKESNWKRDVKNAKTYMEYSLLLLNNDAPKGIIPYVLDKEYGDKITTLSTNDSYKIKGWEVGAHGDFGANGSRGTLSQFSKMNTKIVYGHAHTPARRDGAVQVGTYTKLRLGYNAGPSSWMHCGAILHNNGKVQQILFSEGGTFTTLIE